MSISTRVLRKFTDNSIINNIVEDESDIDDNPFYSTQKKKHMNINRFDLLNQQLRSESEGKDDDDDGDDDDDDVDADNDNGYTNNNSHDEKLKNEKSLQSCSKESMRRKKKRKRKKGNKSNVRQNNNDLDEVERSVQEVNEILGNADGQIQIQRENLKGSKKKGILCVEHKHLNPKTELKKIFGPKIIQADQCKKKSQGYRSLKHPWLVTPRDHWPPMHKLGLSMKLIETKNDIQYFAFEHSINYQNIQKKFLNAVESMYSDNIMVIANQSPYHVDTMIQMSDIFKLRDDLSMAAELIERALYSLETAFHPLFNVAKGNCRLDYRVQENRAFFIALYKHLTFVGQRVCYRTALEFCKLILSLDPEKDPLAVILAIDFYALRSREFDWFLQFVELLDHEKNLMQLPNIAFSKAIALFQLSNPLSNSALQDALLMFPSVLFPLLENCGVQPDSKTQGHPYFINALSSQIPALKLLVQLYVHRNYHIWKEPDMLLWLEKNTLEVLKRVDDNDPLVLDYAEKRAKRFEAKTPREIERHVFLSDIKIVTAVLAEKLFSGAFYTSECLFQTSNIGTTFSFDPLPPIDSINLYNRADPPPRTYENSNPFSLYFQSLMPDFQADPLPNQEHNRMEVVMYDEAGGNNYLQNSVRNLLHAMRNLLSNMQAEENEEEMLRENVDSSNGNEEDNDQDFAESSF